MKIENIKFYNIDGIDYILVRDAEKYFGLYQGGIYKILREGNIINHRMKIECLNNIRSFITKDEFYKIKEDRGNKVCLNCGKSLKFLNGVKKFCNNKTCSYEYNKKINNEYMVKKIDRMPKDEFDERWDSIFRSKVSSDIVTIELKNVDFGGLNI